MQVLRHNSIHPTAGRLPAAMAPLALLLLCALPLAPALAAAEAQPKQWLSKDAVRRHLKITEKLSCNLRKGFPTLLFDFYIHAPYRFEFSLSQLKDSEELFLRSWTQPLKDASGRPFDPPRTPSLLAERYSLRDTGLRMNRDLQVRGSMATGVGEYEHFLSVDNGRGLGCVVSWKAKAKAPRGMEREVALGVGEVAQARQVAFVQQADVPKQADGLRVAILLNADNRSWRRATIDGNNAIAMASTVRRIAEDPRVREVSLTAFSLEDQAVLFEHGYREALDFRGLRGAFRQLQPGTVDLSDLEYQSEARFVAQMLRERESLLAEADLVLFVGARSPVSDKVPPSALESLGARRHRAVAYLITNPYFQHSWNGRDVIGHAVKALQGDERWIRRPEELAKAVNAVLEEAQEKQLAAGNRRQAAQ